MLAGGIAGAAVGSLVLAFGHRSFRRYRQWEAGQTESIPPQGLGFVAPAGVLLTGGTLLTIGGVMGWIDITTFHKQYALPAPATPFGVGIAAVVVGATLMGIGATRSARFNRWRRDTSERAARLQLTPSFGPIRRGAQFGISGRF
jgi:hypothetical protein